MSRQQFSSRNNIGQVLTFQKSGATASFDPQITFSAGTRRVSWRLDNGSNITQTANNIITYTGFTSDSGIRAFQIRFDNFKNLNGIYLNDDNLYGNFDITKLKTFNNVIDIRNNPKLTGITFPSTNTFGPQFQVQASSCDLTGNLDLSPISNLGGSFFFQNNPKLTGITHSISSQNITQYQVFSCNITGNLDLSLLSGLGGVFYANSNSGLTSITYTTSTRNFSYFYVDTCNLTGTLDLSPLTKLGGTISLPTFNLRLYQNINLSGITLPNSNQFFKNAFNSEVSGMFVLNNCNLDYVDFKPLSGATLLTGVTEGNPRISLRNNGMSADTVNHILVDFSGNATYNPTGWSNVNLNISGTNAAPNSSSGGYNGIAARNFLTGSPYNWTITHS